MRAACSSTSSIPSCSAAAWGCRPPEAVVGLFSRECGGHRSSEHSKIARTQPTTRPRRVEEVTSGIPVGLRSFVVRAGGLDQ